MSELRRNPLTDQWVILAENRDQRPQEYSIQPRAVGNFECPFCEGREQRTPGETLAIRAPGTLHDAPGWRVRVVPNKFPVVQSLAEQFPHTNSLLTSGDNILPGVGLHEIIIESPRHLTSAAQLTDTEFAEVLDIYRLRLLALRDMNCFRNVTLFKNSGIMGGATLSHLHSQLVAIEGKTPIFANRASAFAKYCEQLGTCPICESVRDHAAGKPYLVTASENFLAICPFASRFAYEVWIAPRKHLTSFEQIAPELLSELARLFRHILVKLEVIVKLPAYNYIVHTAPFDTLTGNHYHWHIEILPRISNLAGIELGTGLFINSVLPEKAAQVLRDA